MAKLAFFASIATILAALGFATMSAADAPAPCTHKDFKTKLVGDACKAGGRDAAKKAMQDWVKKKEHKLDGKTPTCSPAFCHKNQAPNYDLNDKAFDKFKAVDPDNFLAK